MISSHVHEARFQGAEEGRKVKFEREMAFKKNKERSK